MNLVCSTAFAWANTLTLSHSHLAWSARNLVCSTAVWLSSPRSSAAVCSSDLETCINKSRFVTFNFFSSNFETRNKAVGKDFIFVVLFFCSSNLEHKKTLGLFVFLFLCLLNCSSSHSPNLPYSKRVGSPVEALPFFIIPSHLIRFTTVNFCKSQGGIFIREVPRGYIRWKGIQFTRLGMLKNGVLWGSMVIGEWRPIYLGSFVVLLLYLHTFSLPLIYASP